MTVRELRDMLSVFHPEAKVVLHGLGGNPVMFVIGNANDIKTVALEDAIDSNLRSELVERFNRAMEEDDNELDFFIELLEAGFHLDDIRKYVPERYEYSKKFMEEHGLI